MKRVTSFIFILIFVCSCIFAENVFLLPMAAAGGIPMNPIKKDGEWRYDPVDSSGKSHWVEHNKDYHNEFKQSVKKGLYTDDEMIGLGGIIRSNRANNATIELSAACPSGFYFVSQSDPSYKRPFELIIVPKAGTGSDAASTTSYKLGEKATTQTFSYQGLGGSQSQGNEGFWLWFDLVLSLPGEISNDVLDWNGRLFPMKVTDDYGAIVTLGMKITIGGDVIEKTLQIPFSGWYEKEQGNLQSSTVSVYVAPTASAGNLDLKNYSRQLIATVDVMAVLPGRDNATTPYGVFISSSPKLDDTAAKPFKLVKENLGYDVERTEYNSVGYKIVLVDNDDLSDHVFLGQDYYNEHDTSNLLMAKRMPFQQTHSKEITTYKNSYVVYVEINDNSGSLMEEGRYTSEVYVHVVNLS